MWPIYQVCAVADVRVCGASVRIIWFIGLIVVNSVSHPPASVEIRAGQTTIWRNLLLTITTIRTPIFVRAGLLQPNHGDAGSIDAILLSIANMLWEYELYNYNVVMIQMPAFSADGLGNNYKYSVHFDFSPTYYRMWFLVPIGQLRSHRSKIVCGDSANCNRTYIQLSVDWTADRGRFHTHLPGRWLCANASVQACLWCCAYLRHAHHTHDLPELIVQFASNADTVRGRSRRRYDVHAWFGTGIGTTLINQLTNKWEEYSVSIIICRLKPASIAELNL